MRLRRRGGELAPSCTLNMGRRVKAAPHSRPTPAAIVCGHSLLPVRTLKGGGLGAEDYMVGWWEDGGYAACDVTHLGGRMEQRGEGERVRGGCRHARKHEAATSMWGLPMASERFLAKQVAAASDPG